MRLLSKRMRQGVRRQLDIDGVYLTPAQARVIGKLLSRAHVVSSEEIEIIDRFRKRVRELSP